MTEKALINSQHHSGVSRWRPRTVKSAYQGALEFGCASRVVSAGSGGN